MFGVIYSLLFLVWVFVLNGKIQRGPVAPPEPDRAPDEKGFLAAAASGGSLTGAKEGVPPENGDDAEGKED